MPDVRNLLSALDSAKKQRTQNEALRVALLEAEEYLQRLHANTFTECLRQDLSAAHISANECLDAFERDVSFAALRRPGEDFHQATPRHVSTRHLGLCLDAIEGVTSDGAAEMRRCLERAVARAGDTVDTTPWAPAVSAVVHALRDSAASASVSQQTAGHELEVTARVKTLTGAVAEHEHYLAEGNIEGAMAGYNTVIGLAEGVQGVLASELATLARLRVTAVEEQGCALRALEQMVASDLTSFVAGNEQERRRLQSVVAGLQSGWGGATAVQKRAAVGFTEEGERCRRTLVANVEAQERQWLIIARAEAEVAVLGMQRVDTVKGWMRSCEREARRTADGSVSGVSTGAQMAAAEQAFQHCARVQEVAELLECVVTVGCRLLGEEVEGTGAAISRAVVGVHVKYYDNYRVLRLAIGDLKHKTERLADEVAARVAATTAQQEIAMDSLDPTAKKYSVERAGHLRQWEGLRATAVALGEKASKHRIAFMPTEVALIASGKHFVCPEEEVRQQDRARREMIAEYNEMEHVAAREGRVVAASKKAPRRIIM